MWCWTCPQRSWVCYEWKVSWNWIWWRRTTRGSPQHQQFLQSHWMRCMNDVYCIMMYSIGLICICNYLYISIFFVLDFLSSTSSIKSRVLIRFGDLSLSRTFLCKQNGYGCVVVVSLQRGKMLGAPLNQCEKAVQLGLLHRFSFL